MRSALLASAMAAMITSGCAPTPPARIQGRWRGLRAEGVPAEGAASANAFAIATELRVEGDTMSVVSPSQVQSGRIRVISETANAIVLYAEGDGASAPQTFTFDRDGTLHWSVAPGQAIAFVRE